MTVRNTRNRKRNRILRRMLECAALLSLCLLSGCWDKLELEEQAFVVVIGLDKGPRNTVEVTFQIANPQIGSSDIGTAEGEPPSDTIRFTSSDILSAKELANTVVTRTINFAHLKTMIVSEELARDEIFPHIAGAAIRDPELRREVAMIVSREKAFDFIMKNRPRLETRPHKYYELMQQRWMETGYVPFSTLNQYLQQQVTDSMFLAIYATARQHNHRVSRHEDAYLAGQVPKLAGDPVQMMGAAVFHNGRMVGTLTGEQMRWVQMLRHKASVDAFITSFSDPLEEDAMVTVRLFKNGNTKIKFDLRKEVPRIHVTLPLRIQLLSFTSLEPYATDPEMQRMLIKHLKEQIESELLEVIRLSQKKFPGDPFEWELFARKHFMTMPAYQAYGWAKHFKKAKVDVKVELRLENFGKQRTPYMQTKRKEG
jgi:Ger(x)C family germination protein